MKPIMALTSEELFNLAVCAGAGHTNRFKRGNKEFQKEITALSLRQEAARWGPLFSSWKALLSTENSAAFEAAKPQYVSELMAFAENDVRVKGALAKLVW